MDEEELARIEEEYAKMWETTELAPGINLRHHAKGFCQGDHCCLHNPSDHPMKNLPLWWRSDRGIMERICEHGVGHPDPDGLEYKWISTLDPKYIRTELIHGCDGDCAGAYDTLLESIREFEELAG